MARAITLDPSNELAWHLYQEALLPGAVPFLMSALQPRELTEWEADIVAHKVDRLARVHAELQKEEDDKRAREHARQLSGR